MPRLTPLSAGMFLYSTIPSFKNAYNVVFNEKRLGVDVRRPQVGRELRLDLDQRADRTAQHLEHALNQLRDIHWRRVQVLLAGEREQPLGERGAALGSFDRAVNQAQDPGVVRQPLAQ